MTAPSEDRRRPQTAECSLPQGRRRGVVFSIDDIHPGTSSDAYEAGGDLSSGVLGHVDWLLNRHPKLRATLFTTADWREISPFPEKRLIAKVPWLRDRVYLARRYPAGKMRLDCHPRFVEYLNARPRMEIALHGLHHCHKGLVIPVEFQDETAEQCEEILRSAMEIFDRSGLQYCRGLQPPGWSLPDSLLTGCARAGIGWVASARDLTTTPSPTAMTAGSGLRDVPLMGPIWLRGNVIHFPVNFQATSPIDRAISILDAGGLLSIKAHAIVQYRSYLVLDALTVTYRNYLDLLLRFIAARYGEDIWWTSMDEISQLLRCGREIEP